MEEKKAKLAENLTRLRKKAGETQRDLGEVLGISDKTVSKWETGDSEPGLDQVLTLAGHYGVSADALLAGEWDIEDPYAGMGSRAAALAYFGDTASRTFTFATGRLYPTGTDPEGEADKPLILPLCVKWHGNRGERTGVTTSEIFTHAVSHRQAALCVTLMQNADNYGWLERDADRLSASLAALSKPGMMKLVRYLHTKGAPGRISAEYAAEKCGSTAEDARDLLRFMAGPEETVVFPDGERAVFVFSGKPYLMTALTALHEDLRPQSGCNLLNGDFHPVFPGEVSPAPIERNPDEEDEEEV